MNLEITKCLYLYLEKRDIRFRKNGMLGCNKGGRYAIKRGG